MGVRGLRFVWQSPVAKVAFGTGVLLLVLSIAGFGIAFKHAADVKSLENRLIERGYPLESEVYEFQIAQYSASRARGIAFLLLLGAGAAFFTGTVAGLPSKKQLEHDPAAQKALSESKTGRWPQWTRGRVLATGIGLTFCFLLGLGLWVVGSLRAARFLNSPFPNEPEEEMRGAIEFILGTVLLIGAPTLVALLRKTTFWNWTAGVVAVVIGGLALVSLAGWPPESSWSF